MPQSAFFRRFQTLCLALLSAFALNLASQPVSAQRYNFNTIFSFIGNAYSPNGGLTADSSGALYGTTLEGGTAYAGTIFKYVISSGQWTALYNFTGGSSGSHPNGCLYIDSQSNLYGTTLGGGTAGGGVLFKYSLTAGTLTVLASFGAGVLPNGGLAADSSGALYGTTQNGGADSQGTLFKYTLSSSQLSVLGSFAGNNGSDPNGSPYIDSSGNVYGTTPSGGANNAGVVFKYTVSNSQLTASYSFTGGTDGYAPNGGFYKDSQGNLDGSAKFGGTDGEGTLFKYAPSTGQVTPLARFTGGSDGASPNGPLIADSSGNLYGTASAGGTNGVATGGYGTVFKFTVSNSTLTGLASFTGNGAGTNGQAPDAGLYMDSQGNLYGPTPQGGANNYGTLFKYAASGGALTALYNFIGDSIGTYPYGGLITDGQGNFYGTTLLGGAYNAGTIYEYNATSGQQTALYSFTGGNDGSEPNGCLLLDSHGNLYGTTNAGGAAQDGVVFEYVASSKTLATLHSFTGGADGGTPNGGLVMDSAGNLYGTTYNGGANSEGTIFEYAVTSGMLTTLYPFTGETDGGSPNGSLVFDSQSNLYGTATYGGASDAGVIFEYVISSASLIPLYAFTGGNDGGNPAGGVLIDSHNNLYGTNADGGASGYGTVFKYSVSANQLTVLIGFNGGGGANPTAGLVMDANGNLYGTTLNGGAGFIGPDTGFGTVFQYNAASNSLNTLYSFTNGNDGSGPNGGLALDSQGNLYGTTQEGDATTSTGGGIFGGGTLFKLYPSAKYVPVPGDRGLPPHPGKSQKAPKGIGGQKVP